MKDIKGFEGLYAITSCGKVWSYRYGKFLKSFDNRRGYQIVCLFKDGKKYNRRVHILVAEAFLEKPTDGQKYEVGHLDDCPYHNWVGNLKWMTRKENLDTDSFRKKQLIKIFTKVRCVETGKVYNSQKDAAHDVGIHPYGITCVLKGCQKTAGGYHWERVNEKQDFISK